MNKLLCLGMMLASHYLHGSTALDKQLQQIIDQQRVKQKVNAISLSVSLPLHAPAIHNYVAGTISRDNKTPITANNLFQVGSITKNFTAVLIMQLVSKGKLDLDDPIKAYLPQYPKWGNITIRQLLNHTSGIYDYIEEPNWWNKVMAKPDTIYQPKDLLNIAYQHQTYFAPNQGWHYSNSNYLILGLIIEKLSNKSIQQAIQQLLEKAKLDNTYFLTTNYSKKLVQRLVNGYYQNINNTRVNGSWAAGAAALISTPNQLMIWVQGLFNRTLISAEELAMLEQVVSLTTGQPSHDYSEDAYGLGMFRMNTPAGLLWFTPGLTPGYRALWGYLPCYDIAFAYSVSDSLIAKPIHPEMMREILPTILKDKTVQQAIKKYQEQRDLPGYCRTLVPAKEWGFVSF